MVCSSKFFMDPPIENTNHWKGKKGILRTKVGCGEWGGVTGTRNVFSGDHYYPGNCEVRKCFLGGNHHCSGNCGVRERGY